MIKFFRKIRQRLLSENKFSRYLIYAIGEILLVMIGILLALQVNNWNDKRKAHAHENSYLMRLKSEITSDTIAFNFQISKNMLKNEEIQRFSNLLNSIYSNNTELIHATEKYFKGAWYVPIFNPTMTTFDDLSNTGKLAIISNIKLRKKIVALYTKYKEWKKGSDYNNSWGLSMDEYLNRSTDGLRWDKRTTTLFSELEPYEESKLIRQNKDFYIRNLAVHYWINDYYIDMIEELNLLAIEVLEEIDMELQNK